MIGDRIKELRKAKGWSQKELAEKLNVTQSAIGKWEGKGKTIPSDDIKLRIAALFNVSVDYLLSDSIDTNLDSGIDNAERELLILFRNLNSDGRLLVADYAKMLVSKPQFRKDTSLDAVM